MADALRASLGIDDSVIDDIRATGASLGARVPELIADFYRWLAPQPEFAHFFADRGQLARVQGHQTRYWRDFLAAQINDEYVEDRRAVGVVHARIELGLLIYLRSMEFVSAWLVREVEADVALSRAHPSATFSIRKLIHFDSAVVVDTYAARTTRMLDDHRRRLDRVANVMHAVAEGDLSHRLDEGGQEEVLGRAVNDMLKSLRSIATEMELIAGGDFSASVAPRSDKDQLGASLQTMTRALREAAERNHQHMWLATTQTELGQAMSGNPSLGELSQRVLSHLCRALDAHVGAHYVRGHGTGSLRLTGTYATSAGAGVPEVWELGEGLVGQAALEKRRILLRDVPEGSIRVKWGLGEAVPRNVVVVPLLHEAEVRGVVEIGTLGEFSALQLDLLDRASSSIAVALAAAEARARIQQLLDEAQAQAEELVSQQEELRQVNDTLEDQARALEAQKESLVQAETVLRQKHVELERTSRYKSEFLANMSHELRTPLNSLLILSRLLVDNREGNLTPEQVRYAASISSAGNDLLALVNDILDLAKVESGTLELNIEPVAVSRLIDDLRRRFEPLAAERNLALEWVVEQGCPDAIDTDPQRLQQVLTNLLSNALKFTEKGSIRLHVAQRGAHHVALTLQDTGIGIAPEQHQIIFEAFRQADGTTNRRYGGTGLGLSISRELARMLGGEIHLRSALGEGSAFTVVVPRRSAAVPLMGSPFTAPSHPTPVPSERAEPCSGPLVEDDRDAQLDPRRIVLVIEDDPAFATILRDLARELGYSCVVAGSADEGLRFARASRPVAIVLDIGLPDQSGLGVLELLKRDPATRHVPIHVVSGHDYRQIAREMGAVGYLRKPVNREQLVAAFHALEERVTRTERAVLVVEDDAVQREAVIQLLAADDVNVSVVGVANAEAALAELRSATFDCVVLDPMLPGVSGFELLERMSTDPSCSYPPVIVHTARTLTLDEEQRLRRYSKSIIVKGARSPDRLVEEVTLFLHQAGVELPPEKQRMPSIAWDLETGLQGRRILIVEDDVRNVFALTSMLELKGATIDIARNGKEALTKLEREPADLVLMDVMMPEMDGLEATRRIRARGSSIPIITLTAKAMPADRDRCLAAGANDYIVKPVDVEKLLSLLRVWMPRS